MKPSSATSSSSGGGGYPTFLSDKSGTGAATGSSLLAATMTMSAAEVVMTNRDLDLQIVFWTLSYNVGNLRLCLTCRQLGINRK